MPGERLPDTSPAAEEKERSGEYLLRVLKPAGAVGVLVLLVLFLVLCFTYRHDPVRDYAPARTDEYYALHPAELAAEIRANLLPYLPPCTVAESEGHVLVTAGAEQLPALREALTDLFSEELFQFVASPAESNMQ